MVTDIKLGPEVRTVYDKTEISNDENRFINIVNESASMALAFLKAKEINKDL